MPRMKIVDDDIDWRELAVNKDDEEEAPVIYLTDDDWRKLALNKENENKDEDDEEEAPVIAEIIDERTDEVKQREVFRTSNKWKVQGATNDESQEDRHSVRGRGLRKTKRPHKKRGSDSDLSPPRRPRAPDAQTIAEIIDERTDEVKQREVFRTSNKWKVLGATNDESQEDPHSVRGRGLRKTKRPHKKRGSDSDLSPPRRPRAPDAQTSRKSEEEAEKDKKYAQWSKGLVQIQMQKQNVVEAQKPLARHIDDEDLDKMLREQERFGDPMTAQEEEKQKPERIKERPRYQGPPPPPNRFNIMPGYRWDGVDRSNGFEQKLFSRIAEKKAVQKEAYKWSVEDM
ncbi:hypothetical protein AMELA_G00208410 [Ameiurus melas]|uniref:BUD13 homolog n=1 Tax=Ameiurus melas TaxID=219545 RepID=A0A7J6A684_AMEME|nr:hypothetical protein AMELA_G00208410 [Ameiurus melas]